jgi:hypothetical protein
MLRRPHCVVVFSMVLGACTYQPGSGPYNYSSSYRYSDSWRDSQRYSHDRYRYNNDRSYENRDGKKDGVHIKPLKPVQKLLRKIF